MQNKGHCGCEQGFVPVNGNWDFNCCDQYQQNHVRRTNRRSNDCDCDEREKNYTRARNYDDCQCERCNDNREVECCEKNTYIRQNGCDMDDCKSKDDCKCKDDDRGYGRYACTGRDDCPCENCARNRNRSYTCEKDCACSGNREYNRDRSGNCGCGKDNDYNYNRNRSSCGCDKGNASTYARSGKNRGVGMIKGFKQEIDEIFESESALRAGTIFPELHKPMNGYCPYDGNCGTCKQAAAFAAWELRLYLDTHPNDEEALELFRKLCKEAEEPNYATTFLKDECCTSGWGWVKNAWPWEFDCRSGSDCQCGD